MKALTSNQFFDVREAIVHASAHLRDAAYHQAKAWDALGVIERALDIEVDSLDIRDIAVDFQAPATFDNGPSFKEVEKLLLLKLPKTLQVMLSDGGE